MRPVLVVNPRTDAGFADLVSALVGDDTSAELLESRLREVYPHAIVRRRLLSGEFAETWYVYREGTWIPNDVEMQRQISRQLRTTSPMMRGESRLSRS